MTTTIASRCVRISIGFKAMKKTSSATPASRPNSVRYSQPMPATPATTNSARCQRTGKPAFFHHSTPRQTMAAPTRVASQGGTLPACGTAVASATASSQGIAPGSIGVDGLAFLAIQSQRLQALVAVRVALVRRDGLPRQVEAVAHMRRFGGEYPAGENR